MEPTDDENNLKWAAIQLLIPTLTQKIKKEELNDYIFKHPAFASEKYDGTNVGIDTNGLMYGRNKTIPAKTKCYQKTDLSCVGEINSQKILTELASQTGINEASIQTFVVYGELMCNSGLYNYKTNKMDKTFQIFGAMIKPANGQSEDILSKLAKAGFACRDCQAFDKDSGEDEEDQSESKIMLVMNQAWKDLIDKFGYPTVNPVPVSGTLYDIVMGHSEWMLNGNGEGVVIALPAIGDRTKVAKWKIGAEENSVNIKMLSILQELLDDKEKLVFGDNTDKAVEFFRKLEEVCRSNKVMGVTGGFQPLAKPTKVKNPTSKAQAVVIDEELMKLYFEPIKSAKTKFDHEDVYFAKGMKACQEFTGLIAKETLNDVKIDEGDSEGIKKHNEIIAAFVKADFVEYMKNNAGKKGKK